MKVTIDGYQICVEGTVEELCRLRLETKTVDKVLGAPTPNWNDYMRRQKEMQDRDWRNWGQNWIAGQQPSLYQAQAKNQGWTGAVELRNDATPRSYEGMYSG